MPTMTFICDYWVFSVLASAQILEYIAVANVFLSTIHIIFYVLAFNTGIDVV